MIFNNKNERKYLLRITVNFISMCSRSRHEETDETQQGIIFQIQKKFSSFRPAVWTENTKKESNGRNSRLIHVGLMNVQVQDVCCVTPHPDTNPCDAHYIFEEQRKSFLRVRTNHRIRAIPAMKTPCTVNNCLILEVFQFYQWDVRWDLMGEFDCSHLPLRIHRQPSHWFATMHYAHDGHWKHGCNECYDRGNIP
jgi:hypothetical protein